MHGTSASACYPELSAEAALSADEWAKDVSDVTVLCSASRGGSSLLFRVLAASEQLLTTRGEETPLIKATVSEVRNSDDDSVTLDRISSEDLQTCRNAIFRDIGVGVASTAIQQPDRYVQDLAHRIPMQWNGVTAALVKDIAAGIMNPASTCDGTASGMDAYAVFTKLLSELERRGLADSRYYDRDPLLPAPMSSREPSGPPLLATFVEEPPFIPILPRQRQGPLPGHLLFKAPSGSHRLALIERLFPNAKMRVLHLTRNPAASVNGLMDGWSHWGFFSRDVSKDGIRLNIKGYSDRHDWGRDWWNFDLPRGWKDHTNETLEEVCAFQWKANHESVLNYVDAGRPSYLRIRFEDIVLNRGSREKTLRAIADFIGISDLPVADNLPGAIMSTSAPRPRRWKSRHDPIMRALNTEAMSSMINRLGYDINDKDSWI